MSDPERPPGGEREAVEYLRRTLVELGETRRRLQEAESRLGEPIAIVGMSCRYPGGIESPEDLWELVSEGRDAVSDLPDNRGWDREMLLSSSAEHGGAGSRGGFLYGACDFDAGFFGIDEHQALLMDPAQRMLLETAWEACESAGIPPTSLRGRRGGVFVGTGPPSYSIWLLGAESEGPDGHMILGNVPSMWSGRVAHMLGLEGPAVTIDTACSSSAVALHLACQSLRVQECSLAFVGGATVMSAPWMQLEFSRQRLLTLAGDGRCKSFADGADGTGFSEGVGMLVLERLSDARREGHEVHALIRGSAVNQDGVSNGLTAPNGLAHEEVIRQALANAGLSPGQVDAVEAHGMGTELGDPIEAQALMATYGRHRDPARPLWLGSIKSNIGHSQASGAMAGVIKMVMGMRHGQLPRTLHAERPSRHVDWSSGAISLLVDPVPWEKTEDVRRAAVHSLGISGTNVHILLEEPPTSKPSVSIAQLARKDAVMAAGVMPWVLSGRDEAGLRRQAGRLAEFVQQRPELNLLDVAFSLAVGRAALSHRAVFLGEDREQLLDGLRAVAEGEPGPRAILGSCALSGSRVAFVMASGAAKWIATAGALMDASPAFAAEMGRLDEAFSPLAGWSLRQRLHGLLGSTDLTESLAGLNFGICVSLAALWRQCGIEPSILVGCGPGELAAAYVGGILTLKDVVEVITGEGSVGLTSPQPPSTAMTVLSASSGQVIDGARLDGQYWSSRADCEPAMPGTLTTALLGEGCRAFVEIGLNQPVTETLPVDALLVSAAPMGDSGVAGAFSSMGQLWVEGVGVDWVGAFAGHRLQRTDLPTYAFDRRRYWLEESPLWSGQPSRSSSLAPSSPVAAEVSGND